MTTVLYTEQAGSGHVFARQCRISISARMAIGTFGTCAPLFSYELDMSGFKRIEFHPRPGTFEAIGCWSLPEDLRNG